MPYTADSPVAKRALSNPASYAGNSINIGGVNYNKNSSGQFVADSGATTPTTPSLGNNPAGYSATPTSDQMLVGRDMNKEKAAATKLGLDANSIAGLKVSKLLESTYTQAELANMPYYQYMKNTEAGNANFSNMQNTGQIQAPTSTMMRPLEEALKTKMSVGKEKLGESDVFKAAGLDPYINLAQSLRQHSTDMDQKYASYANVMGNVAGGLSDTYKGALQQYKDHVEQYNKELDRITTIIDRQAALDQQLTILEKQSAINKEQRQWELDHPGLAARTSAFTAGMTDANGNVISSKGGSVPTGEIVEAKLGQDRVEGDKITYKAPVVKGQQVMIDALQKADAEYFAATGEHIKINESYRSTAEQAAIRKQFGYTSDGQASGEGGRPMAAAPGKSFHQTGLAIDIPEDVARKAEQYLRKYGLVNDVPNDYGHFSMGETNPDFFAAQTVAGESPTEYNKIVNIVGSNPKMNKDDRASFSSAIKQAVASGNYTDAKTIIKNTVRGFLPADQQNKSIGRELTLGLVANISDKLKEYEKLKGDTGVFVGNEQKAWEKIGKVGNPKLAEIAKEIQLAIQGYRQSMTGMAFSEKEGAEYKSIFPNETDTGALNTAKIKAIQNTFKSQEESLFKYYIGEDGYNKVIAPKPGEDLTASTIGTTNATKLGMGENFDPWALIKSVN